MHLSTRLAVTALFAGFVSTSAQAQSLQITGACGAPGNVNAAGLTANSTYAILTAGAVGQTQLPVGPCAGTWVSLDNTWQLLGTGSTNAQGEVNIATTLPNGLCGMAVQFIDAATCRTTNTAIVGSGGPAPWAEDFETGTLGPQWTSTGNLPWEVDMSYAYDGVYGAHTSAALNDSESSSMSMNFDYGSPGQIAFWHATDSEPGWDYLRFFIDGVEVENWSGLNTWASSVYNVAAGPHTFTWMYDKDASLSVGADMAYIDLIEANGGVPVP